MNILSLLPFYLIGAIPTGFILAKINGIDITKKGSNNPGATNVARVLGTKAGLTTLILDLLKGILAVVLARTFLDASVFAWAGFAAVLGHCYSIPGLLKGGKGVATGLGVFLTLAPLCTLLGLVTFGVVFLISRIISLSSIVAALVTPLVGLFAISSNQVLLAMMAIALLVVARHKPNIQRLLRGEEPKFTIAGG